MADRPHEVSQIYITECYDMKNGTAKYRVKLCCENGAQNLAVPFLQIYLLKWECRCTLTSIMLEIIKGVHFELINTI